MHIMHIMGEGGFGNILFDKQLETLKKKDTLAVYQAHQNSVFVNKT